MEDGCSFEIWVRIFFFGGGGGKLGRGVHGCGFVEKYLDGLGCFYQKHTV